MMKTPRTAARPPLYLPSSKSAVFRTVPLFFICLSLPLVGQVHFDQGSDRIGIQVNGKPFSTLHYGKQVGKPYLHPLMTASGKAVTRGFPDDPLPGDSTDRPHLRGMIMGAEKVSTASGGVQDFWENDPDPYYAARAKASIVVKEASGTDGADRGTLSMLAHWISTNGQLWIIERCKMTFYAKPADSRMFDVDLELEGAQDVTFPDDKDAIVSLRLGLPFDVHYGGRLVSATGGVNEAGTKGQRSPWVDWVADLQGEKIGVAMFDQPPFPLHFRARKLRHSRPALASLGGFPAELGNTRWGSGSV
jgi:hypothetical protein